MPIQKPKFRQFVLESAIGSVQRTIAEYESAGLHDHAREASKAMLALQTIREPEAAEFFKARRAARLRGKPRQPAERAGV